LAVNLAAMLAANILIVPVRPSQPDLDTHGNQFEIIDQAKDFNEQFNVHGFRSGQMQTLHPDI